MRRIEKYYFAFMMAGIMCMTVMFSSDILAALKDPCSRDIAKFCKNANPENNGIIRCLEEHESELSQECRNYEMKLEGRTGERREAVKVKMRFQQDCKTDIAKFCKDVDPGGGGLVACIYKSENEASASCKAWIKADKAESGKTQ